MIDASRWTGNERDVVIAALAHYAVTLRRRQSRSGSTVVTSDCQWRLVIVQQALDAIYGR